MKITHILKSTVLSAILPLIFLSCKKDNATNQPAGKSSIKFQLQTINRTSAVNRVAVTTAGNIVWTSGTALASEIKFEAESNNQKVEFKSETPQHIDLFSPIATLGTVNLPAGTYDQVEFKIELTPSGSDPALQLNGEFTSGGVTTPVTLMVSGPLELKTEKENVVITDNTTFNALTTISLSSLTNGVTENLLNNAVRTNGAILISSSSNTDIYNMLFHNFDVSDEVEFEHD